MLSADFLADLAEAFFDDEYMALIIYDAFN